MVTIPPQLDENIRSWHGREGSDWLEALPAAVAGLAARWGLTVGEPFGDDGCRLVGGTGHNGGRLGGRVEGVPTRSREPA